ncbi:unnamed protein product [Amoebophrya sp. A25]|nr:unnamed protein product [Amoebophrya sp. A25]|eukprot:GSA25T00014884001.1
MENSLQEKSQSYGRHDRLEASRCQQQLVSAAKATGYHNSVSRSALVVVWALLTSTGHYKYNNNSHHKEDDNIIDIHTHYKRPSSIEFHC